MLGRPKHSTIEVVGPKEEEEEEDMQGPNRKHFPVDMKEKREHQNSMLFK
jgi:hypothetical protein